MTTSELERHIGIQITDVAQGLEELKTMYNELIFKGFIRMTDIDNNVITIEEMVERLDKFATMVREIEHNFKYV